MTSRRICKSDSAVSPGEETSNASILANDDMFLMADLAPTDFHHPLLGNVIRLDGRMVVKPEVTPDLFSTPGEWGGLQHASQLISGRFPKHARGYLHHMPKALTVSLVHEASVMFEESLTAAATRGFRRSSRGLADIEMHWLVSYLRIERWREALLWSWAVARLGGLNGVWDGNARREIGNMLNLLSPPTDLVIVKRNERKTLHDIERISQLGGWDKPKKTKYIFCMSSHLLAQAKTNLSFHGRSHAPHPL